MAVKFDTVKAGDVLYSVYRRTMGNTTMRETVCLPVEIDEIDHEAGYAKVSHNGNRRRMSRAQIEKLRRTPVETTWQRLTRARREEGVSMASNYDEALSMIRAGRCPNDGGVLIPMYQRPGYGQCSTCKLGWSAYESETGRAIGQFADRRHYNWFPNGTGLSYADLSPGGRTKEASHCSPAPYLVPWLLSPADQREEA